MIFFLFSTKYFLKIKFDVIGINLLLHKQLEVQIYSKKHLNFLLITVQFYITFLKGFDLKLSKAQLYWS